MENKKGGDNNLMWLALAIGGGVLAYTVLRKDVLAVADTAKDGAMYVLDKANPISQGNVLNRSIEAVGQAITQNPSWTSGGAIFDATAVKTDPQAGVKYVSLPAKQINGLWHKQLSGQWVKIAKKDVVVKAKGQWVVINDVVELATPAPKATNAVKLVPLPAREVMGQWQKQVAGVWMPISKSDTIRTVKGSPVVFLEVAA